MTSSPYDAPRAPVSPEPAVHRSRWLLYGVPMLGGMTGGMLCVIGIGASQGDPFPPFLVHGLFLAGLALCALPSTLVLRLFVRLHWAWRLLLAAMGTVGVVLVVLVAIAVLMPLLLTVDVPLPAGG